MQLQTDLKDIEAAGLTIVGISYDSVDVLAKFTEKRKITYPLLSDSGSKTITAYGRQSQSTLALPRDVHDRAHRLHDAQAGR